MKQISLVQDTISHSDIDNLIEWLQTHPRLTKGEQTLMFEQEWAEWLGTNYAIFVNSGSSANLLMLSALKESGRLKNDKVVVPAVSWATDLAPVMQLGMKPILCDCNLTSLSVNTQDLEAIFFKEKPSILLLVSVLGLVPDMSQIVKLCKQHDVILLEDTCESMGSKYNHKKLGTFGLMSSFSLYYGHHLSTIEGGMVCTNDKEIADLCKSIRSHGWDRDLSGTTKENLREKWGTLDFDALYTFYYPGYNLRSTDLQAFIGREQLKRIEEISQKRNKNFHTYNRLIKRNSVIPIETEHSFISNFAYPVIDRNRETIVDNLSNNGVEVRPLIAGSMGTQPFFIKKYGRQVLPLASLVQDYGFYLPNNDKITTEEITFICDIVNNI